MAKKKRVEFGVGHDKLTKNLEKLTKAHKALEGEHSTLTKSFEQLQIQSTKIDAPPSSSTSSCDHANIIEDNARLKNELDNIKGKSPIDDLLQMQRPHVGKEGLGYVAKKKKKNKKKNKKAKPAQAKKTSIASGVVIRDETTHSDFSGTNNPHHILYVDYYGDVHAKYVGLLLISLLTLFGFQRPVLLT